MRPDEASVEALGVEPGTMVVIMTHSFGHDRNWLKRVLDSRAQYIGLLGPRARADEMLAQLDSAADGRVFAPVGLNLGADGPEQIAISVVSELLAFLSRQQPGHLREKQEAIHAF
jgi:xanthine/CO dehydrogenase XdhC/CoxF family maturation factor